MKSLFVENNGDSQKIYNSILVEPKGLSIFSNELALKIVGELAKQPMCAMDIAKKLRQHEQKVYYHLRKMRDAGIVQLERSEARFGMTAKIYSLVSPVIAAKLHEDGCNLESSQVIHDPEVVSFLSPFINKGELNAKIIVGDPYPHGKYDAGGLDGCYTAELTLFLGNFLKKFTVPCIKLDILTHEHELRSSNLILIGNPKWNVITQRINKALSVHFDEDKEWAIVSKITGGVYNDDLTGIIVKCPNPFNRNKKIIVLGGRRTRGTHAAVIAFTRHISEIMKGNINDEKVIAKVVRGIDTTGDGSIDEVKFLE